MYASLLFIDINECEMEIDNCHANATCNNTFGSFECTCNAGFEGDGINCTSKTVEKGRVCIEYMHYVSRSRSLVSLANCLCMIFL